MLINMGLYHLIALKMYNTDADIPCGGTARGRATTTHTRGAKTGLNTAARPPRYHQELNKVE